jgi:hypothetical protein
MAWDEALDTMTVQQRVVGALNGMHHVWEYPCGPREHNEALIYKIVSFQNMLWVSKFDNNDYQCNTVAGENQWYAGSTSHYSKAYGEFAVLI